MTQSQVRIFTAKDGELEEQATTKEFLVVRQEGNRQMRRRIKHHNLDAIIYWGTKSAPDGEPRAVLRYD